MKTSKSILAVVGLALLAPAVAMAQWNPLVPYNPYNPYNPYYAPAVVPQGALMPEGHPPGERPWAYPHFFVWHDGGGWHLRVTTPGQYQTFSGSVYTPTGLGGVNAVIAGTPLSVSGQQIQFNLGVQGGENGFDWQQQDPCATFNLLVNGVQVPGLIDIGAYSQHPFSYAPFQMCAAGAPPPPEPPPEEVATPLGPEMDPEAFQSVLSPYGQWVNVDPYGLIWEPNPAVVGADFVPYQNGHWIMTDAGWTWASDFEWGWGPFHYGNWVYLNGVWGWVPGRVWAPAWVNWRYGGGYSGWGPIGYGGAEIVYPGYHYIFVENGRLDDVHYRDYRVPPDRIEVVERSAPAMPLRYANGHPVVSSSAGPPRGEIERAAGHPIHATPMSQVAAQHHMMPPANAKGVHYANGASPSHPFVAQKVQATAHPPAAGGPAQHEARPESGGGRPAAGEQRPMEAHPQTGAEHPAAGAPAAAAKPAAGGTPKSAVTPPPAVKKKKP